MFEWFDSLKRAIVPKSHAEALVDEIYGQHTVAPDVPEILSRYEPGYSAYPAPVVRVKQKVTGAIDAVGGAVTKYAIVAIAVAIVLLLLYGFLPEIGRKLAK